MDSGQDIAMELASYQSENEWNFCCAVIAGEAERASVDCAWLDPKWLMNRDQGKYWERVLEHRDPMRAANEANITTELLARAAGTPMAIYYQEYARAVSEGRYLLQVYGGMTEVARTLGTHDSEKIRRILENLSKESPTAAAIDKARTPAQLHDEFMAHIKAGFARINTYTELDRATGGLFGQEMSVLAGRPGTGKSAYAMQVAVNIALSKKRVLFLSLEMDRMQLWARLACSVTGISWMDVRAGKVDQNGLNKLDAASKALQARYGDYLLVHDSAWTMVDMHRLVAYYQPELVIIDHLGEIHWHDPDESPVVWYGLALRYMHKCFCREMGCHTMVIHQLNRDVEGRADHRPLLADLRWSGEIEQRADVVLMTYRDDIYNSNAQYTSGVVPFELWVRKNRQGIANICAAMSYDLSHQTFSSLNQTPPAP